MCSLARPPKIPDLPTDKIIQHQRGRFLPGTKPTFDESYYFPFFVLGRELSTKSGLV